MKNRFVPFLLLLLLFASAGAQAQNVEFFGDARFGLVAHDTSLRNADREEDLRGVLRLRGGFEWTPNEVLSARVRLAGRYLDEGNSFRLRWQQELPGGRNLPAGYTTFDEAHLRARYGNWEHRLGRFQYSALLAGVPAKSMSRTNSKNSFVSWTDGLHSRYHLDDGWQVNAIVHRNTRQGPTLVHRSPLDFTDSESRATYYLSMDREDDAGTIVQRSFDLTFIPGSLRYIHPSVADDTKDYLGFTGRVAVQQPLAEGRRLVLGVEAGYAPTTPRRAAVNLPGDGDAGGTTWQLSANLMEIAPGHSIGLVYGETDAGWLLSTDFTNNQALTELRYQWRVAPDQTFHFRIRQRDDLKRQLDAQRRQSGTDLYIRYTMTF